MSQQPLRYTIEVGPFRVLVREIHGVEELSRPWRLEARFALDPHSMQGNPLDFDPDAVIKETATVVMEREGGGERRLQGIVTEAELEASVSGHPEARLVLEPRLALLGHRQDVRIHRNLTAPAIVREVCAALGVTVETRLRGSYPVRPYSVQWRETDLAYVSRLLEDEGIFYYFTRGDVMVLGDHPAAYEAVPGEQAIPFRHAAGATQNEDAVHEIGSRAAMTAGKVTLRDWNTEHPSLDMDVSHLTAFASGPEWYDFPGEYEEPSEGRRKARLHAEAFDRAAAALTGTTTSGRLYPGATFTLVDAPAGATGGRLVVRRYAHDWDRDREGFAAAFEADPAEVTYRPARATFVPRIFNPLTGFVTTSSASEDIHCDHFGRVKVHFPWDRLWPKDDTCSHWIPVLQDNTGGSSAIPRKDFEVLVHFLEGDPDRPIVLGRLYNGEEKFKEKLPYAKYRSGLRSMTTPTRIGSNEIRLEDLLGSERMLVHAELDQNIRIANDLTRNVDNTDTLTVKNDESVTVGNDSTWTIANQLAPRVGHDQTWEVQGNRELRIGASENSNVSKDHQLEIGGDHEREIFTDDRTAAKNLTETIEGSLIEKYKTMHNTETGTDMTRDIGGSFVRTVKEEVGETTTQDRKETIGGSQIMIATGELKVRCNDTRKTKIAGSLYALCPETIGLTGAELFQTHSSTGQWLGTADVTLKVKDDANESVVMLKGGLVLIQAPQNITIRIGGPATEGSTMSTQI